MSDKHSPGPWTALRNNGGRVYQIDDANGSLVAWPLEGLPWADGELMAAAPLLLAVCKRVIRDLDIFIMEGGEGREGDYNALLNAAEEAVEAAEGAKTNGTV